ncbi:MAG: hypothetical protein ACREVN_04660 [Gammaproteobacteria bacterium]
MLLIIATLAVLSTLGGMALFFLDLGQYGYTVVQRFWLGSEGNIPTLFAAIIFLFAALLLGVIWRIKRRQGDRYALHWGLLALLFGYLGFDEGARIHELAGPVFVTFFGETALFTDTFLGSRSWILAGSVVVLLIGAAYFKFLRNLPAKTRSLVLLAAAMFITAALGLEILGGIHERQHGQENIIYGLLVTTEEVLEMGAIALLIYALLVYLRPFMNTLRVSLVDGRESGGKARDDYAAG